ncbi:hypothetical protein DFJ58DRAFT_242222 [Suillus subalutaceus]|uniref:uncharacterized protein n=1 Tax=Suillus subalutaceus TaxID=48586 RepID=UPI001B8766C7|nr:uncharacterized protein DFJ58DRAFT_242222 [Suillus subalutaceus]KAG1831989.1 hypothetical protein DFJ58DRAFT_242222 [Suillus subalutaceus]
MYKPHTHSCLFNSLVSLFSFLPSGSNQVCLTSAIIVLYRFSQAVSYVLLICTRHLATHVTCYFHHLARSEFVKKILWCRIFDGECDGASIPCADQLINDCLSIGLPTGP